jgi:adenylate kinase
MDTTAQIHFVERRTRDRRRQTRRAHDRNHINERRQMAVVVYLVMAAVAGGGVRGGDRAGVGRVGASMALS